MPLYCHVCGEREFECENGMYFCVACSTQSQQCLEEEAEDAITINVSLNITAKRQKEKTTASEKNIRPWVTSEGFTVILREQVDALIKLGASPALKDVVLRLWMFYLKKLGLGFGGTDKNPVKLYGKFSRNNFVPTFTQARPVNVAKRLAWSKTSRKGMSVVDKQNLRQKLGDEVFDEIISTRDDSEVTEVDMLMEEEQQQQDRLKSQNLGRGAFCQHLVQHGMKLSLPASLAFCYIGLQFTNNLVIPYDLIKAVKVGQIPYNNALQVFPADMKLTGSDWRLFCADTIPSVKHLRHNVISGLCRVLEVLPLPAPNMELLTLRFLFALNLPGDLHMLIRAILRRYEVCCSKKITKTVPSLDILAMAYLIIAVKMVFGLNDEMEYQCSELSSELSSVLGPSHEMPFFCWSDWMRDQAVREKNSAVLSNDWRRVRLTERIEPILQQSDESLLARSRYNKAESRYRTHDQITRILEQMCTKVGNIQITQDQSTNQHAPNPDSETSKNPIFKPRNIPEPNPEFQDFTEHSIAHLLDWDIFMDNAEKCLSEAACSKLRQVAPEKSPRAWEIYVFYSSTDVTKFHTNYRCILDVAVTHLGCSVKRLHFFVSSLEVMLFLSQRSLTKQLRVKRQRFKQFYFNKS